MAKTSAISCKNSLNAGLFACHSYIDFGTQWFFSRLPAAISPNNTQLYQLAYGDSRSL